MIKFWINMIICTICMNLYVWWLNSELIYYVQFFIDSSLRSYQDSTLESTNLTLFSWKIEAKYGYFRFHPPSPQNRGRENRRRKKQNRESKMKERPWVWLGQHPQNILQKGLYLYNHKTEKSKFKFWQSYTEPIKFLLETQKTEKFWS